MTAVLSLRRGVLSQPLENLRASSPASLLDVRSRYGPSFKRAMRLPEDAFWKLVNKLQSHLPSRGHVAELTTAMSLHYPGEGATLTMCHLWCPRVNAVHLLVGGRRRSQCGPRARV